MIPDMAVPMATSRNAQLQVFLQEEDNVQNRTKMTGARMGHNISL